MISSDGFSIVQTEWLHCTSLKKYQKMVQLKKNIALFLHSNTMAVAPCLHLSFKTKVGIMCSIDSDHFFSEITIGFLLEIKFGMEIKILNIN